MKLGHREDLNFGLIMGKPMLFKVNHADDCSFFVYCHPAYLTYMQSTSWEMSGWMKHTHTNWRWCESSVQLLSSVWLFATLWSAARKSSLSIINSQSLLKLMSIETVMPSSHLILCHHILLLPPIPPSIRVFSNESTLHMRWPEYSASTSVLPMNTQDWSPLGWTGWISLQSMGLFSNTTVHKHQFFSAQLSSQSNSHIHTWPQEKP